MKVVKNRSRESQWAEDGERKNEPRSGVENCSRGRGASGRRSPDETSRVAASEIWVGILSPLRGFTRFVWFSRPHVLGYNSLRRCAAHFASTLVAFTQEANVNKAMWCA